jgi:hypothetical protein
MKKMINEKDTLLSKFEESSLSNLNTIFGGTEDPPATTTLGYSTKSSATDADTGDHDDDDL